MNQPILQTFELCKHHKGQKIVDKLSLQVHSGEVFGFLGPNGAGKSSSIKMMLGLSKPSSGRIEILGGSPQQREVRAKLGFLPEQFRFQTWMTGRQFLAFQGKLAGLSAGQLTGRIDEVLAEVGLQNDGHKLMSQYSKGMLQRCGLAASMLARPRLIFLDEPTSALDPLGRMEVRAIIERLRAQGCTVFLNSHLLSEVEAVCDRVAFIYAGRLVGQHDLRGLQAGSLRLSIDLLLPVPALMPQLTEQLEQQGVQGIQWLGPAGATVPSAHPEPHQTAPMQAEQRQTLELQVGSEADIPSIVALLVSQGALIYAVRPSKISLEQLFLNVIEEQRAT